MGALQSKVLQYIYQLISLVKIGLAVDKRNLEDTYYQLLHDRNYDEALKLALQHKYLDKDLVYKCKWRNSGITVQLIDKVLSKIQDKLWAINECVQTVPVSFEACQHLLEFGLEEANLKLLDALGDATGGEASTDSDHLTDQQDELCRCRQSLLKYEHSLSAYKQILGDYPEDFNHVFYDEFRRKPPLQSCIEFANSGNAHAVETCLDYYTDELKTHILAILSNFPETLSPYQYRNLLPCLRGKERTFEWRSLRGSQEQKDLIDWSKRGKSASTSTAQKKFEQEFYQQEVFQRFHKTMTSDVLSQWFIHRALEMEDRTSLLYSAIQLLHLGSELNIKDLRETHDDLVEFDRVVHDCCSENNLYLSYKAFSKMSEIDRLILMTSDSLQKFTNSEDRYKLLAKALANCDDPDGRMSVKILENVIQLRKRDSRIQMAYLKRNM